MAGGFFSVAAHGQPTDSTFVDPGPSTFQALWTDANNWDTAAYPDNGQPATDDTYNAIVDDGQVALNADISIQGLTLDGSGAIDRLLSLSGESPPRRTLTLNAPFAFKEGRVGGNVTLNATAGINFTAPDIKRINAQINDSDILQPIVNVGGSSTWTDGEIIGQTAGSTPPLFNLLAGADLTATAADRTFGARFDNAGTVNINPGTGATQTYRQMNNDGTVNVLSGTAEFASTFSGIQTSTGDFVVDSDAAIVFESHSLETGSSVTGGGDVTMGVDASVVNGTYDIDGTTTLENDITFANPASTGGLVIDGPTFGFYNGPSLTASDITTYRDGVVLGNLVFNADGGMAFESSSAHRFEGDIAVNLDGQTTLDPGQTAIRVSENAELNVVAGGTLTADGAQSIEFQNTPGSFSNAGTIHKTGGGTLSFSIPTTNTGLVVVEAGNNINFRATSNGGLTQTAGELRLDGGSLSGIQSLTGGSVTGFGTINGGFDLGAGSTLAPGHAQQTGPSVGTLDIISLEMQAGATTEIELAGTNDSDFDRLLGEFSLGGDLMLELIDGFEQDVAGSDTFEIVASDEAITGQFANVAPGDRLQTTGAAGSFIVNYGASSPFGDESVVLSDFVVPEPTSLALLGLGGALMLGRRRRRSACSLA